MYRYFNFLPLVVMMTMRTVDGKDEETVTGTSCKASLPLGSGETVELFTMKANDTQVALIETGVR